MSRASTAAVTSPAPITRRGTDWIGTARVLVRLAWARTGSVQLVAGLVVLLGLPLLFALVFASRGLLSGDPVVFLTNRYDQLIAGLATPLLALLLGTSAFSAETDDGTLLYLLTTTTPRWWIVAVRVVFAAVCTGVLSSLAVWGTGLIAVGTSNPEGVVSAFTIAAFHGGVTYAALFTLLALLTRRALVGGLVYVIVWEQVLSQTFLAIRYLSVRQWMLAVAGAFTPGSDETTGGPGAAYAVVASVIVVALAIGLGGRRLARPRLGKTGG